MSLEPLTFLILLFFIAVVLSILLIWFVLTLGGGRLVRERRRGPDITTVEPVRPPSPKPPSNDLYRGAAVKPERPKPRTDAFENFIRSTNDELEF